MARYTEQELSELKQSVNLAALIQSRGIKLEKHGGRNLKGLCPFHNCFGHLLRVPRHRMVGNEHSDPLFCVTLWLGQGIPRADERCDEKTKHRDSEQESHGDGPPVGVTKKDKRRVE